MAVTEHEKTTSVEPKSPRTRTSIAPTPSNDVPPRLLRPIGHAIIVIVVALVVGAFLNAQGLRKSAHRQSEGWQRDVALAVTKPLADVSAFLRIDRPRQEVKEAIGRGDDDTVDTEVNFNIEASRTAFEQRGVIQEAEESAGVVQLTPAESNTPSAGEGETSLEPGGPVIPNQPLPAFSPEDPLRVWVGGDSLSIVPGQSIFRIVSGNKAMEAAGEIDGRLATGLSRPDVFNWFRYIPRRVKKHQADVVVLTFGANDDKSYMTGVPEDAEVKGFGGEGWIAEYRRRVAGLMDVLNSQGRLVVWIGLPVTRDAGQTERYRLINRIYRQEAAKRDHGVIFIDTADLLSDVDGNYADYIPDLDGQLVQVRAPDGVHFHPEGGDLIATEMFTRLKEYVDTTSWRLEQGRTETPQQDLPTAP